MITREKSKDNFVLGKKMDDLKSTKNDVGNQKYLAEIIQKTSLQWIFTQKFSTFRFEIGSNDQWSEIGVWFEFSDAEIGNLKPPALFFVTSISHLLKSS